MIDKKTIGKAKRQYTELKNVLQEDKVLLFKLLQSMILKPSFSSTDNTVILFHCSKHTRLVLIGDETVPPTASFFMENMVYSCNACRERGYDCKGSLWDLVKFTYDFGTYPQAYDKVKFLLQFIMKQPVELLYNPTLNNWYTLPTEQDYKDFRKLLFDLLPERHYLR